ncbi:TetR/AcrR family transcriptional regulator [uncultured Sunxiuqinia sp.]|uniref:TetR/AcrR family transcriptional regulator n=1 Tax=uncultured Sunxiuqinia sp. TaxID=1573825 RepID=UPI0030DBDD62|tara:strand:- start:20404 stop:21003 length:600 start_codon:yes stop_codon:yes gene_type:complete
MEVRARIIEEATRLFFQYGIRSITMDEIAVSLGISKRTVYETFKDKTELIHTCLRDLIRRRDERRQEVISSSANVIDAIFTSMQDGIKAINTINPLFFHDLKRYYPVIWKTLYEENKEKHYNLTCTQLRKGVNEGLFRKDIHIGIVSKLFHEQMNLISDESIFPREQYELTDLFKNLMINFVRGISTQKGIDLVDKMLD